MPSWCLSSPDHTPVRDSIIHKPANTLTEDAHVMSFANYGAQPDPMLGVAIVIVMAAVAVWSSWITRCWITSRSAATVPANTESIES